MRDPVKFWQAACVVLPLLGLIAPIAFALALGGFGPELTVIGRNLPPTDVFGLLGAMCFPFAGYYFARMRWEQAEARASRSWPTAPGKILTSDFREASGAYARRYYRALVSYTYRVGAADHSGDRLFFGWRRIADPRVVDLLSPKYTPEASVSVRYDPAAPEVSVLETSEDLGASRTRSVVLCLAAPFVATALVAIAGP
jgi:hypothetical protein